MPFEEELVPLWEPNGENIVAYVDGDRPFYVSYYFEDGPDEYKVLGYSYQAFLIDLFAHQWELERRGIELQELTELFQFRYLQDLLQILERYNGSGWDRYQQAIANFLLQFELTEKTPR